MQELFTTKSLVYRSKPNRHTLQLIKEFEQLQGMTERTLDQDSRHRELLLLDPVAQEIRITVGTVNALQQAKYQSYLRKARSWFEQESGMPPADFIEDVPEEAEEYDYLWGLLNMSHAWAGVFSSTRKYEVRNYSLLTSEPKGEWEEFPIPAEWKSVEGFLGTVQAELLWNLNSLANEVNPNLWHVPSDDESKKFGVMSVT